MKFTVKTKI